MSAPVLPKQISMDRVSRPLVGLLVATVAFFALWVIALKPTTSGTGSRTNPSLGQLAAAIAAAHGAVATSNAASVAHGGTIASAATSHPATAPRSSATALGDEAAPAARAAKPTPAAAWLPQTRVSRLATVTRALETP